MGSTAEPPGRPGPGAYSWPDLLTELLAGDDLLSAQTAWVMDRVMTGEATSAQVAAFVVALRAKGETPDEVAGLAASMLAHAVRIPDRSDAVDVVGTGGDRANTVNISTMAAVVAAAAGVKVVKHGNRAASSSCGSADLVEALGIPLQLGPADVAATLTAAGIGFCFAPVFHPALRHVGPTRRELGIPTVFNFLGPLTNPAQPSASAIGCGNLRMAPVMAQVFARRGSSALVFRGDDGLDELTTTTTSTVWVVSAGKVRQEKVDPAALGIALASPADLRGGDVAQNLRVARELFEGRPGPVRDAVSLNAAAAVAAYTGLTDDLTADLTVALRRVDQALNSGAAATVVDRWVAAARARVG